MNKLFAIIMVLHVNTIEGPSHDTNQKTRAAQSGCSNAKVVLDLSKITNLPKWELANAGLSYEIKNNRIYIDLAPVGHADRVTWLSKNNGTLKFDESAMAITCMHTIPNIGAFTLGSVKSTRTFGQIKAILKAAKSPLIDSCEKFVALSFDANNEIEIKTTPRYDPAKRYYSMALFMAISRSSTLGDALQFTFYKAVYQGAQVIVIEVAGTSKSYYDFAQYPLSL